MEKGIVDALAFILDRATAADSGGDNSAHISTRRRPPYAIVDRARVYQVFVRSFYDSDGDGNGDLRGLIDRLDYLNDGDPTTTNDLGIGGIWLLPIHPASSYHGYDVIDYYGVHPDYGSLETMRALVKAANARGIAVIIDLVINHSASANPWFQAALANDPTYDDWYVWSETDPGYRGPDGQVVWHNRGGRYYYGVFWGEMPDLNLRNPQVTAELYRIAEFWLREVGVDGFRLDGAKHLIENGSDQVNTPETIAWLRDFNAHVKSIAPDAFVVAEVWDNSFILKRYTDGEAFDAAFEFDLASAAVESAWRESNQAIDSLAQRAVSLFGTTGFASFLTNHDQNRVMSTLRGNVDHAKSAAALLLTGVGVPFIYYGEEIGMTGQKPDPRIRTPMHWTSDRETVGFTRGTLWEPLSEDDPAIVSVAAQDADPDSLLNRYRALVHLRNVEPALRHGDRIALRTNQRQVYAFMRAYAGETLLVLINLSNRAIDRLTLRAQDDSLSSVSDVETIFNTGDAAITMTPQVGSGGGFRDYIPLERIAPYQVIVARFIR